MKWFRSNIGHGARLALLALVVQFALSFGHSHGFMQATAAVHSTLPQAGGKDVATIEGQAAAQQSPANQDRDPQGDDICAICAVVAMARNLLLATPPLLLPPQAVQILCLTTDAEFIHLKSAGTAFQPRAPPAS
ncbi:MAG: DUF2946 family protein [Bradyrhizobium sp.]|uniref:DUF2946 family protein n=1 Tax=Bradyrhizobium sp. TaxID=376 RepID=UPI0025C704A5|nr:DUF2946 family protein [Bradyrhizobium sp.]MBI5261598.1 DUF2946 family protein [Bradyrhizobium sp.]